METTTMAQYDPAVAEAFDVLADIELPNIQEDRFVREFLPMFAAGLQEKVDIGRWLDVAGHAHLPVNVLRGETFLFRVPPLLRDAGMLPGDRAAGQNMYENILTAEKKRAILPALGDAHLRETVINRVKHEPASLEYVKAWNSIFTAYGYPTIALPAEAQAAIDEKPVDVKNDTASTPEDVNDEISGFTEL